MKLWSIILLLLTAAVLATIPVSAVSTTRGLEFKLDTAEAVTYRRARVATRRAYRYDRRAYRRGAYVAPVYRAARRCYC